MVTKPIEFILREADANDMEHIFQLANDPVVRAVSINQSKIEWSTHIDWYKEKLKNPDCLFLIIEAIDGQFIGQIRFDVSGEDTIVNISLAEPYRSKGVARPALFKATAFLFTKFTRVKRIFAYIRLDNLNSVNLFIKCGFLFLKETEVKSEKYHIFILDR